MLLGFKERFVEPIQNGTKIFTLRSKRKITPKIGETLYMYTGLRTSHCYKISDKHTLKCTQEAYLYIRKDDERTVIIIEVDNRNLNPEQIEQFAINDGFLNKDEWAEYWLMTSGAKVAVKITTGKMDMFHWTDFKY